MLAKPKNAVVVFSGGLDSLVLLYYTLLNRNDHHIATLFFFYGQRSEGEFRAAQHITDVMGVELKKVDVSQVSKLLGNNSLTNHTNPTLEGKSTVVPGRNSMFLSIAASVCEAMGGGIVLYGAHKSTNRVYPDTTPEYVEVMGKMLEESSGHTVKLEAPLIHMTKTEVVAFGNQMRAPMAELSWSCYANYKDHCGVCYACQDRKQAFKNAAVPDTTVYLR